MADQSDQNKHFCFDFTKHGISEDENEIREFVDALKRIADKWCFQIERCPSTGSLHYQGRLALRERDRITGLVKKLGQAHYSITSNMNKKNFNYVMKEESRVAGPWSDNQLPRYIPRQIRDICLRPWQETIVNSGTVFDPRGVNVIVDFSGGSGKSTVANYIACHGIGHTVPFMNDYRDIMRTVMCLEKRCLYIIDIPRALPKERIGQFYGAIESLKDGHVYDDRYAYKEEWFDSPTVWVFTNILPDVHWLSFDRWILWAISDDGCLVRSYPQGFPGATL